ncbi:NrsF family protein [Aurantimonas sp. VKM B-3413]|uniref:NrsF family protein n=1 Tax=Aurantimonas sp. VKM B-3413 TaxID=2779401 RepID=UPI001E52A978|nr:NrsF family protein [Aurantimonas sp. VKM B-3413]MCB8836205.1 NrsF family protein [Aurantimonas sp. VKM B-3413]
MNTDGLIDTLVADAERHAPDSPPSWWLLSLIAAVLAAAVFFLILGPRPDFLESLGSIRFDAKFVVTGLLALAAISVAIAMGRPAASLGARVALLAVPAILLFAAVLAELLAVPSSLWMTRMIGSNSSICLTAIPTIGAPVLLLFMWGLKRRAPTQPARAGAVAGLAAGGVAAFFYAAHCTDDSPLFVALWYPLATLILVAAGAIAGSRLLRW